jgi:CO/xanthine dehydrogenase FAD-binding subunit
MRPFTYASVSSLEEALRLLAVDGTPGEVIRLLAGGTDLITLMKSEVIAPARVVDIKRAGLPRGIEAADDGITIGALTTLAAIESSPVLGARYPALVEAAAVAATPQLRNMATIAGNLMQRPRCWYFRNPHLRCWLKGGAECPPREGENQLHAIFGDGPCHAVHPSDLAPALVALDAEARLRGRQGERTVPVAGAVRAADGRAAVRDAHRGRRGDRLHPAARGGRRAQHVPEGDGPAGLGLRPRRGGRPPARAGRASRRGSPGAVGSRHGPLAGSRCRGRPHRGRARAIAVRARRRRGAAPRPRPPGAGNAGLLEIGVELPRV